MANFYGGRPGQDYGIDSVVIIAESKNQAKTLSEKIAHCPYGINILIQGKSNELAYCKITDSTGVTKTVNLHNTIWMKTRKTVNNEIAYQYVGSFSMSRSIFMGATAATYNDYQNYITLENGGFYS